MKTETVGKCGILWESVGFWKKFWEALQIYFFVEAEGSPGKENEIPTLSHTFRNEKRAEDGQGGVQVNQINDTSKPQSQRIRIGKAQ